MSLLLVYLGQHWRALTLATLTSAGAAWVGRHSVTCPSPPPPPPCEVCKAEEAVVCPSVSLDAGVRIRWIPNPAPQVVGCPAPPPLPEVTVEVAGVASGGSSEGSASTALPPPSDVPRVAPVAPQALERPHWMVLTGAGVDFQGHLAIPAGVQWDPFGWPVGIGVLLDLRPAAMTQSAITGTVSARW